MHLCYLDESGTPEIPGNTSHYILAGLAIPIWNWKRLRERNRQNQKKIWSGEKELHTAWILRAIWNSLKFPVLQHCRILTGDKELKRIRMRNYYAFKSQETTPISTSQKDLPTYRRLCPSQLSLIEEALVKEVARCVSDWGFARLYAECIDKINFQSPNLRTPTERATYCRRTSA